MAPRLDFKTIAEAVGVEQVAAHFGLKLKQSQSELRCACPTCGTDDERSLVIYPETASYRCYAAQVSGDSISLYAHLAKLHGMYAAAKAVSEQFGQTPSLPQKPQRAEPTAPPAREFDPNEYASKLVYNEHIEALGVTEQDAQRLGIGWANAGFHRGSIVFAMRNEDGSIAGFVGYKDGVLKFPTKWQTGKVVQLRRA